MRRVVEAVTVLASPGARPDFAAVSTTLWSEREALQLVLSTLCTGQLALEAGSVRWLSRVDAELQAAVQLLRLSEIVRSAEAESLARSLNLPPQVTLAQLATASVEPWPAMFADHRVALCALVREIEVVAAENERLLGAGSKEMQEELDRLGRPLPGDEADAQ